MKTGIDYVQGLKSIPISPRFPPINASRISPSSRLWVVPFVGQLCEFEVACIYFSRSSKCAMGNHGAIYFPIVPLLFSHGTRTQLEGEHQFEYVSCLIISPVQPRGRGCGFRYQTEAVFGNLNLHQVEAQTRHVRAK